MAIFLLKNLKLLTRYNFIIHMSIVPQWFNTFAPLWVKMYVYGIHNKSSSTQSKNAGGPAGKKRLEHQKDRQALGLSSHGRHEVAKESS
jgi:hypothetical protein